MLSGALGGMMPAVKDLEKDSRDKTWKSWATWNLILSITSKSHLTSFTDEFEPWHVPFYIGKEFKRKTRYKTLLSLVNKTVTHPRGHSTETRFSLSRFNFHGIKQKRSRKKTLLFKISLSSNKTEILAYVSFSWPLSSEPSFLLYRKEHSCSCSVLSVNLFAGQIFPAVIRIFSDPNR